MTLPLVLLGLLVIALAITIATDNLAAILKVIVPAIDWQSKKLVMALVLTTAGIIGYNQGIILTILNVVNVPMAVIRSWFVYFDMGVSILILTTGAQGLHKLVEAIGQYQYNKRWEALEIIVDDMAEDTADLTEVEEVVRDDL